MRTSMNMSVDSFRNVAQHIEKLEQKSHGLTVNFQPANEDNFRSTTLSTINDNHHHSSSLSNSIETNTTKEYLNCVLIDLLDMLADFNVPRNTAFNP